MFFLVQINCYNISGFGGGQQQRKQQQQRGGGGFSFKSVFDLTNTEKAKEIIGKEQRANSKWRTANGEQPTANSQ